MHCIRYIETLTRPDYQELMPIGCTGNDRVVGNPEYVINKINDSISKDNLVDIVVDKGKNIIEWTSNNILPIIKSLGSSIIPAIAGSYGIYS